MEENLKTFESLINRQEKAFELIDSFNIKNINIFKQNSKLQKQFEEEVLLLRGCNENIDDNISNSVLRSIPEFIGVIEPSLKDIITNEVNLMKHPIESLSRDLVAFSNELKRSQLRQLKKMRILGMLVVFSFCIGSLGTGIGIWWLFPQYKTVEVSFTPGQRKSMEQGALLKLAFPKLSKNIQEEIVSAMGDSWEDYYAEMFRG